ncbi:RNA-binding protein [Drancourtella sp. An210]|uniref:YlmH/Sll1252 family protein n=1 Tax=Sellimonas sp. TaxID=2021466 RepID=UPI000B3AC254|nr:YlmH/Sll1252 family protein [uncultured Sellimonas sp.]OUP02176.1 RNA-binding protein [Drancourtella sp. An210]OUP64583.1 RNA-binding protein [Drancourtella sp. An177]
MEKEEILLQKRLIELSRTAYQRGIVMFSDFLNLNELNILHTTPKDMLFAQYETFGGYASSERQMAAFLPDALCYEYQYPFSAIRICPLGKKFAEELSHRDYLGAVLNLGIERCTIGDILVLGKEAVVFVEDQIADFLTDNLTRIRHTSVMAKREDISSFHYEPAYEVIKGTVASVRLDSLLAQAFGSSRSRLSGLIEGKKVFVNGKLILSNGYRVKEEDVISVRGLGKFKYMGILSETRKGRCYVEIRKYI